jgi:NADH-quinone oxidoreductase subunit N
VNDSLRHALTDWVPLVLPEAVLLVAACALFLGGTFRPNRNFWGLSALAALAVAGFFIPSPQVPSPQPNETTLTALFSSPVLCDGMAFYIRLLALLGGTVLVLLAWNEIPERTSAEYQACILVIVAGTSLAGTANDLITLFLSLELVSIPTYVLLYLGKHDKAAQEAAMKYFLLSIFSSALLLFGFSYLYGLSGTTNIPAIVQALGAARGALPSVVIVALVTVVGGLGFRITAVPFHFYAPDVYQGAPTSGAALLSFVPKVAGFASLIRVVGFAPPLLMTAGLGETRILPGLYLGDQVSTLFWILAAVTMTLGNVLALWQDNLKRLLAYSGVAHAGYMLIGLAVAPYVLARTGIPGGVESVLFYLAAYGGMTVGAFAVLSYLNSPERPVETVDDLAGVGKTNPGVGLMMALFLFSLIGVPLTAGFTGKLFVFLDAMSLEIHPNATEQVEQARLFYILALIAAVNAAIGGYYYLRIVAVMYLRGGVRPPQPRRNWPGLAAVALCAAVTIALGVPAAGPWLRLAEKAVPQTTQVAPPAQQ